MDYQEQYQNYLAQAMAALEKACGRFLPEESEVCRAARYSLMGGGKRIRAVLVLSVCDMLGGSMQAAQQFAAAVEMLHCYSLIHDDLPCMDIGALLADGLGDTIRVSLSEEPEAEIPVARKLVDYITSRRNHPYIPGMEAPDFNYLSPVRRKTRPVRNIGGNHLPVVLADRMDGRMETHPQFTPDYIYAGRALPEQTEPGVQYILDADVWKGEPDTWPAFNYAQLELMETCAAELKFLFTPYMALTREVVACLKQHPEAVVVSQSNHPNRVGEHRALAHQLAVEGLQNPVIFFQHYAEDTAEDLQVKAGADMGALIFDGLCDGIYLFNQGKLSHAVIDATAFGILQAGRIRTSKTEYISCPGCGRTLFNLQSTIARVKEATSHLKGLKIGIMGCIVNGPGEMADADYGYVGAGRGKISLYKQKECIEKNIPEEEAVEKLIELIKANGDYEEKTSSLSSPKEKEDK